MKFSRISEKFLDRFVPPFPQLSSEERTRSPCTLQLNIRKHGDGNDDNSKVCAKSGSHVRAACLFQLGVRTKRSRRSRRDSKHRGRTATARNSNPASTVDQSEPNHGRHNQR